MDTSLHVQPSVAGSYKVLPRVPNADQVSLSPRPLPAGKPLPQDVNTGTKLPLSADQNSPAQKTSGVTHRDDLHQMAVALATQLSSPENIEHTERAVEKLNEILKDRDRDLEFTVDQDTGHTILKVIHTESGDVVRQIPPEEFLRIARVFIDGAGSLIDDQA